jgi:fatty acid desaturase
MSIEGNFDTLRHLASYIMNMVDQKILMTQADYAKKLRPLLPAEAFVPNINKVWILLINIMILIVGWAIASYLDRWNPYYLWLYLPIAIVMGNSIAVLGFSSHGLLHSSVISIPWLRQILSLLGFTMLWMPSTLWKVVHNREHHYKTNSEQDPDRNYSYSQPNSWGKWMQNLFVPSSEINPILLIIGMMTVWGMYTFRHLTSVLFFNNRAATYPVATFSITEKEQKTIVGELLVIAGLHLAVLASLQFSPMKILLGYFLPIWIGYAIAIFYIYTHHLLCPMTSVNDVLVNTLSIRVPKIFDALHINFSYHAEHHIFPNMNPDYYPLVQELLLTHYPDQFNLVNAGKAWKLMRETPRHYLDENTLTDWSGTKLVPCPNLNNKQ